MNGYLHLPQPPEGGVSVAKIVLIGSVISLVGGLIVTASAIIAYNNSLQTCPSGNSAQMQMNCKPTM